MEMWREGPTAPDFEHRKTLSHLIDKAVAYINSRSDDKPFYLYLPLPAPHTPIVPDKPFQGKSGLNPYGDFVMEVDHMIGRIVEALTNNGIEENTLLIFTADNGCSPMANLEELEDKGHYPSYIYRGYKADLYGGGPSYSMYRTMAGAHKTPHGGPDHLLDRFHGDIRGYNRLRDR